MRECWRHPKSGTHFNYDCALDAPGQRVSFTEYASQWTEAQRERSDGNHSTPEMAKQWPFSGKRCISPGGSDYYPAGVGDEPCCDETETATQ